MRTLFLFVVAATGCSSVDATAVSDPGLCRERTEVRVKGGIGEFEPTDGTYQQLIFDGTKGDTKLLHDFMWQNSFSAWAVPAGDKSIVFVPGTDATMPPGRGDPKRGIDLACRASWLSKVPFVSVHIRSKADGSLVKKVQAN